MVPRCSGYHYCTTSVNKAWTQVCTGSNFARSVSEICDGGDRLSTIPQNQFIIIIIYIYIYLYLFILCKYFLVCKPYRKTISKNDVKNKTLVLKYKVFLSYDMSFFEWYLAKLQKSSPSVKILWFQRHSMTRVIHIA